MQMADRSTDLFINENMDEYGLMAIDFDVIFREIPCFYIDITMKDVTGISLSFSTFFSDLSLRPAIDCDNANIH